MANENCVKTKDLPVVSSGNAINPDDRVMLVYRVKKTEDMASYSIRHEAFTKGIAKTLWDDGSVAYRYYGMADPSSALGNDGDMYFKYDANKMILAMFIKYNGTWQNP